MYDLISFGELLIDFTPLEDSGQEQPCFIQNPGGGPANLACAAAKFGCKTTLISKVGQDKFGLKLKQTLQENKVDVSNLILSKDYKTTLAFVHLEESGERSFSFYRNNGADTMIELQDINFDILEQTKYFFFSSVLMSEGSSRDTSFAVLEHLKTKPVTIIFDPNLRLNLWQEEEDAKACIKRALYYADVVKVSEEELLFLTEQEDVEEGSKLLREAYNIPLLLVTLGEKGCLVRDMHGCFYVEGFKVEKVVDTTAAGDSFTGAFISQMVQLGKSIDEYKQGEIVNMVRFSNAVGALTITKKGAIVAIPSLDDIIKLNIWN